MTKQSVIINTSAAALCLGVVEPRNPLQAVYAFNGAVKALLSLDKGSSARPAMVQVVLHAAMVCARMCSRESAELVQETVSVLDVLGQLGSQTEQVSLTL